MKSGLKNISFTFLTLSFVITINSQLSSQVKFELNTQRELTISGISLILTCASFTLDKSDSIVISDLEKLNKNTIPKLDRISTYHYSESLSKVSDALLITSLIIPVNLILMSKSKKELINFSVMYIETFALNYGLTSFTKSISKRYRPYVYNPDVPLEKKISADANKSFFSGHTSTSFAMGTFFSQMFSDLAINKSARLYVWVVTLSLATSVGILRIFSGYHYPSDVIIGALVGSSVGLFITEIHKAKNVESLYKLLPDLRINFTIPLSK